MLNHPDAALEQAALKETLALVAEERGIAEAERVRAEQALESAHAHDPDSVPARELLVELTQKTLRQLALSLRSPYFTRIDFAERGGAPETLYIGRTGVLNTRTLTPAVIDWRAPVANLYYSGQLGAVKYEAPDGAVEGELTLKRQLSVTDGQLQSIFDTDIASRDAYLQSVLGAMTSDRLREIVTTIQAEQNYVIRYPLGASLIVQGVAGSGKTTIALHRIAYLLYAHQKQLRPDAMLILAPNPLFLNFIAGILPELGVEQVRQSTFERVMREWLGARLPKIDHRDRAAQSLGMTDDAYGEWSLALTFKGSAAFEALLNDWLVRYEARFAEGDVAFGPVVIYGEAERRQFLLIDEKPFPMERRLDEWRKQLVSRATAAARRMEAWLIAECDRRLKALLETERDPEALKVRRAALVNSRDKRRTEVFGQVEPFVEGVLAALPSLDPAVCYRVFLEESRSHADAGMRAAARYTLDRLDAALPHEPEDIAPIALIAQALTVLKRPGIRHIVVDEAQDFSPLELSTLTRYAPTASVTLVGDLMQGILTFRGLHDWRDAERVLPGKVSIHHLVTSYRSTVEIMGVALRVLQNRPIAGLKQPVPVLRHGEVPAFYPAPDDAALHAQVESIASAWQRDGLTSIAVIARDGESVERLLHALPASLGAEALDTSATTYQAGLKLCAAASVKGFEFDGVILLDAGAAAFPDDARSAPLLYVALTRALHRMAICHKGALTPLLRER